MRFCQLRGGHQIRSTLYMIRCVWVGTNIMADGGTGVVQVRGVVAAVGVHVGDVGFD